MAGAASLGRFAVLAALVLVCYAIAAAVLGARVRRAELVASAVRALRGSAALLAAAALVLLVALATRDYTFQYVAAHVDDAQPLVYDLTAFWGGMEGSLLLWALVLAGYTLAAVRAVGRAQPELLPGVIVVLAAVAAFFLLMLTAVASPFATVPFAPLDGRGMNPLLLNPWMAIHPPTLYLGYVGLTVPFAIVIAALAAGPSAADGGVLLARRWMMWAWYCLSMGLWFGAKWSYVVLGWGGYWAWDPVENAALMPWLIATAFIHSVMIQERREMLTRWNVMLVILAFALSIFGTFLTRSGVLSSVHSFTQSPLGTLFLIFLGCAVVAACAIAAWRWEALRSRYELDAALSRESAFVLNNVLFLAIAFAVFLGTVFPVLSDVLTGRRVNVGPPFFDHVVPPIAVGLLVLMGVGPLLAWRRASAASLRRNFLAPGAAGTAVGAVLLAAGMRAPGPILVFALAGFVAGTIVLEFARGVQARQAMRGEPAPVALVALVARNRRRYGGYIVHFGMLLLLCGITGSSVFATQRVVTLAPGEAAAAGPYRVRYEGLEQTTAAGALTIGARLRVFDGAREAATLVAARNLYLNGRDATSSVALRSTPRDDLYITLVGWTPESGSGDAGGARVTLRLLVNPLVMWMWAGGLVLSVGAIVAMLPEARPRTVPVPAPAPALGAAAAPLAGEQAGQ
ncbi:MAG TPA: cytochrome c-type biogenesis CcmF C-terminal domain-containing protein [bacterium]|nr:cytochrome c-type biogenesis CcmF C-terminal domain-containing protein [bacterium]